MPDSSSRESAPLPEHDSTPAANISGGVSLDAMRIDITGDVVGRDKTEINAAAGATVNIIVGPEEKPVAPLVSERQYFEPEMLLIAAGPFLMGSQPRPGIESAEMPQHEVTLLDYHIGKYPITNREYAEFVKRQQEQDAPKGWLGRKPPTDKLDHPVVNVSWTDAVAYCKWLSQQTGRAYRLPTEAEWEKAARGTDGRVYPWGNSWLETVCNAESNTTTPVTAHSDGASPFDCQDMLGNVEEWTSTLWGSEPDSNEFPYPYQADGREDMEADQHLYRVLRIHRGGSYRDAPGYLRCSARGRSIVSSAVKWRGFRIALEA